MASANSKLSTEDANAFNMEAVSEDAGHIIEMVSSHSSSHFVLTTFSEAHVQICHEIL